MENECQKLISTIQKKSETNYNDQKATQIKNFVESLNAPSSDAFDVAQQLSYLIVFLKEQSGKTDQHTLNDILDVYQLISKGLRRYSKNNNAMKYFYYGVFQASVDDIIKQSNKRVEDGEIKRLLSLKNMVVIIHTLYDNEECYQSELSRLVKMNRSNLYRDVKKLIDTNLVEERKIGNRRFYSLSANGRSKYSELLRKQYNENNTWRVLSKSPTIIIHFNSAKTTATDELGIINYSIEKTTRLYSEYLLGGKKNEK